MINIENAHLDIAAASHPGMTGKKNEDRYGMSAFRIGAGDAPFGNDRLPAVLAVVCDGIGGHRAGEVAAQMGVTIITETVKASCEAPTEDDGVQPLEILEEAIQRANHAIYQASLSDQGRKGMGATCACAWVMDDRLYTANLGDSRIYLLREGHILQLTTDHTWIQEAFDAGIIDETQGEAHPNAHVIRRYLGSPQPPNVDFRLWFYEGEGDGEALDNQGLRLLSGDVVLICSDGLTDLVSDEQIHGLIQSTPLAEAPAALIALANARGGHDNSTVVLMAVPPNRSTPQVRPEKQGRRHGRRWLMGCLVALMIIVLLAAGVSLGMRWWAGRPEPVRATATPTQTPILPLLATQTKTEVLVTMTPTVTWTPLPMDNLATPRPTITPWPTHTTAP
jgi:PPM family protein phosphatase